MYTGDALEEKILNELKKNELMATVIKSEHSYEEIMAFIKSFDESPIVMLVDKYFSRAIYLSDKNIGRENGRIEVFTQHIVDGFMEVVSNIDGRPIGRLYLGYLKT